MSEFNKFDIVKVVTNKRQEEVKLATILGTDRKTNGEKFALIQYHHNSCEPEWIEVQYLKLHIKLSPCPFCENEKAPEITDSEELSRNPEQYVIVCSTFKDGCGASGGYKESEQEAVENWNNRPET